MADEVEEMGPVGYLVAEFPAHRATGEGLAALLDLVDRGLIRILDLAFVRKEGDRTVVLELDALDGDGTFDVSVFDGASSGLLGADDVEEAAKAVASDTTAAVLLYENRWAARFTTALRRNGAQLVAAGFIPLDAIAAALDASP